MVSRVSLGCAAFFIMGCAAATSSGHRAERTGRDVITAAEIVAARVTDAYQAVLQLRPEFLRRRGSTAILSFTPPSVRVYLDDVEFGTAESLRQIPLGSVRLIRYISPGEADLRWGGTHAAGAIHVTTLK